MTNTIQTLISQMTLAEKAALCTGASMWTTTPVERLGIPELLVSDGPHGIRRVADVHALLDKSEPATCFPTASSLAATWDGDLLYEMGQALAEEAIALGVDVLLGPGVNMKRTPLCGRNFEYFAEDPFLAGEFDILIGASAADIRCTVTATMQSTLTLPSILNRESTIHAWQADPRGRAILEPFLQQLMTQGGGLFGDSGENAADTIGLNPMDFLADMPLLSVLHFQDNILTQSPEEIVDNLLQQVYAE